MSEAHHSHANSCVSLVPIFNHLTKEQMAQISQVTFSKFYPKDSLLYQPEESSDSLYIVNQGLVRVYHLTDSGKEQLIRFLKPGDFTGEMALFQTGRHESFAQAVKDTSICILKRKDLQSLLEAYPTISIKILEEFSARLKLSEKQTTLVSSEKVEARLAQFLGELLDQDSTELTLPMSKKDLASYLGTTPETISRTFTLFEKEKLIVRVDNKHIRIPDLDALLLF